MKSDTYTVKDLEDDVWRVEQLRIIVRAPKNSVTPVYDYKRAAANDTTIQEFKKNRLNTVISQCEYVILNGDLEEPHGKTKLSSIRSSY